MSKTEPEEPSPPSKLSLQLFVAKLRADKTLPESVRDIGGSDYDMNGIPALLHALKAAVGDIGEN